MNLREVGRYICTAVSQSQEEGKANVETREMTMNLVPSFETSFKFDGKKYVPSITPLFQSPKTVTVNFVNVKFALSFPLHS